MNALHKTVVLWSLIRDFHWQTEVLLSFSSHIAAACFECTVFALGTVVNPILFLFFPFGSSPLAPINCNWQFQELTGKNDSCFGETSQPYIIEADCRTLHSGRWIVLSPTSRIKPDNFHRCLWDFSLQEPYRILLVLEQYLWFSNKPRSFVCMFFSFSASLERVVSI